MAWLRAGDLSKNNWWVGILAWGEGWHNNHHAFEFSARHGLEDHQVDVTWGVIKLLEKWGLAWDIKLPSEAQKARLAFADGQNHTDTPY
jgi:fatty-acid desaturase